jgi:FAD/FMN-containing dehydrogenase
LISTQYLDHFISLDRETGILECESGVTFESILKLIVPQGWFLPVTPGTKFITVGGAIANDVHGKNHHQAGNFGHHVISFELLRSDGQRLTCSRNENSDWFFASIGGLGLTGLILKAKFKLKSIVNPFISQEVIRFGHVDEFMVLSEQSEHDYEYTVSWIDCLAKGKNLGRGLFIRGNHSPAQWNSTPFFSANKKRTVPFDFPNFVLNPLSVLAFNQLYYRKQIRKSVSSVVHYDPFFYPLDAIHHWNRIYGRTGFLQYQFVVPYQKDRGATVRRILEKISAKGSASFLTVMKIFGQIPSLGMMSFPKPGITVALDFRLSDQSIFKLLDQLDEIVLDADGAVYPAKDARMSSRAFQIFYPDMQKFSNYIDPKFSSSFWRRIKL